MHGLAGSPSVAGQAIVVPMPAATHLRQVLQTITPTTDCRPIIAIIPSPQWAGVLVTAMPSPAPAVQQRPLDQASTKQMTTSKGAIPDLFVSPSGGVQGMAAEETVARHLQGQRTTPLMTDCKLTIGEGPLLPSAKGQVMVAAQPVEARSAHVLFPQGLGTTITKSLDATYTKALSPQLLVMTVVVAAGRRHQGQAIIMLTTSARHTVVTSQVRE